MMSAKEEAEADEVSVAYTSADIRAVYHSCARCSRSFMWLAATPALFAVFSYADGVRGINLIYSVIPFIFIGLAAAFALYFIMPLWQVRGRKKTGWDKPMLIGLSEQSISIRHPAQDSQFHWAAIQDVVTGKERLFLFTSPGCAIILPRRCFASDTIFSEWVSRAEAYWQLAKTDNAAR